MKPNPQNRLHVMHVFKWHFNIPELLYRRMCVLNRTRFWIWLWFLTVLVKNQLFQAMIYKTCIMQTMFQFKIPNAKSVSPLYYKEAHLFSKARIETSLFGVQNCTNEWNDNNTTMANATSAILISKFEHPTMIELKIWIKRFITSNASMISLLRRNTVYLTYNVQLLGKVTSWYIGTCMLRICMREFFCFMCNCFAAKVAWRRSL